MIVYQCTIILSYSFFHFQLLILLIGASSTNLKISPLSDGFVNLTCVHGHHTESEIHVQWHMDNQSLIINEDMIQRTYSNMSTLAIPVSELSPNGGTLCCSIYNVILEQIENYSNIVEYPGNGGCKFPLDCT